MDRPIRPSVMHVTLAFTRDSLVRGRTPAHETHVIFDRETRAAVDAGAERTGIFDVMWMGGWMDGWVDGWNHSER